MTASATVIKQSFKNYDTFKQHCNFSEAAERGVL